MRASATAPGASVKTLPLLMLRVLLAIHIPRFASPNDVAVLAKSPNGASYFHFEYTMTVPTVWHTN